MKKRKIIFLGTTRFSFELLKFLTKNSFDVIAVFTTPEIFEISYSEAAVKNYNYADLSLLSRIHNIPLYNIHQNKKDNLIKYKDQIKSLDPEIILVAGWYFMIPEVILNLPKDGVWGIHSSLLPEYAGGAPLVWAKINGEKYTGVTLFRMIKGVDNGDIIGQEKFKIEIDDSIKHLLDKSFQASKKLLIKYINKEKITYKKQNYEELKVFPQRSPNDGEIDWTKTDIEINNFIKAQTKPYPGAWTIIGNYKVIIWDAKIEKIKIKSVE